MADAFYADGTKIHGALLNWLAWIPIVVIDAHDCGEYYLGMVTVYVVSSVVCSFLMGVIAYHFWSSFYISVASAFVVYLFAGLLVRFSLKSIFGTKLIWW
ncbi:MAG: hypothetical protein ABFQ53_02600 [Patescibacteria group bacterium]